MSIVAIVPDSKGRVNASQLAAAAYCQIETQGQMTITQDNNIPTACYVMAGVDLGLIDGLVELEDELDSFHPLTIWAFEISRNHDLLHNIKDALLMYIDGYLDEARKHHAAIAALKNPVQESWINGKRIVTLAEKHAPRVINNVCDDTLAATLTLYEQPERRVVAVATDRCRHLFDSRRQTFPDAQTAYNSLKTQIRTNTDWREWLISIVGNFW